MKVDIIIIVATRDCDIGEMTQQCINSCHNSSKKIQFNVNVIETFAKSSEKQYNNSKVHYFINNKFNYNAALNFGASKCNSQYIGFFNNDLFFEKGWCEELIKQIENNKIYSTCPYTTENSKWHDKEGNFFKSATIPRMSKESIMIGYDVRRQILGWAIFMDRKVFDTIGGFDTSVEFWYSDNIYAQQLQRAKLKHMVCYDSHVNHLENITLNKLSSTDRTIKTHNQRINYLKAIEENKYKFSIIMPSHLMPYPGNECSIEDKKEKLRRAIKSVLEQSFKEWELIIISDGCQHTIDVYQEFSDNSNIICLYVEKQQSFSGFIRQSGIDKAKGERIIYLDSDDKYGEDHLKNIDESFKGQWCYFNDCVNNEERDVYPVLNSIGTSCICHRRSLNVTWSGCDRYGHDWLFIKQLLNYEGFKIDGGQYNVCHIPKILDI